MQSLNVEKILMPTANEMPRRIVHQAATSTVGVVSIIMDASGPSLKDRSTLRIFDRTSLAHLDAHDFDAHVMVTCITSHEFALDHLTYYIVGACVYDVEAEDGEDEDADEERSEGRG